MLDFVRTAYSFDMDKVLGGPSWLEMDRFDITAKIPPDANADTQKLMLQSLLADRFKLVVHREMKPLPTWVLKDGKKPLMKDAEAGGSPGCRPQTGGAPGPNGGPMIMFAASVVGGSGSEPVRINLGPDMMITYECRNMSMDSFVVNMRSMIGANLGTNPVLNETKLEGRYSFDVKFSFGSGPGGPTDRVTLPEAVEKQLGLKMEQRPVPTPVLIVDKVNQTPTPNPPGVEEKLPPVKLPTEFDVASVKPSDPGGRGGRFQMQPGGHLVAEGMPMQFMIMRAFNTNNRDAVIGIPKWAETERYDINAKAASDPNAPAMDQDAMAPLIRSLLVDRFGMKFHTEDRDVQAYKLIAAKPKLKKADPENRTNCKNANAPPGAPQGSRLFVCQNITLEQFADKLSMTVPGGMVPGFFWPIEDGTGIEGNYDISLLFSQIATMGLRTGGRGEMPAQGPAGAGGVPLPNADDPGGGVTLFEALEKQLGLKLDLQKRKAPVWVIDHLEQKATEN
jgi:uncharacterized protein (TIGR03435 family)